MRRRRKGLSGRGAVSPAPSALRRPIPPYPTGLGGLAGPLSRVGPSAGGTMIHLQLQKEATEHAPRAGGPGGRELVEQALAHGAEFEPRAKF